MGDESRSGTGSVVGGPTRVLKSGQGGRLERKYPVEKLYVYTNVVRRVTLGIHRGVTRVLFHLRKVTP